MINANHFREVNKMEKVLTTNIRNVALLGHGGCGKTTLAEAILYAAKDIDRVGKVGDGNTVCDYDPEEIKRGFSISTAVASTMWKTMKINIIDTPGYLDFVGETCEGLRAADAAVILVDGRAGLEVGTEIAWDNAKAAGVPRAFFVNKCDDSEARFGRVYNELREKFGNNLCPLFVPVNEERGKVVFVNLLDMSAYTYDQNGARKEIEMTDEYAAVADKYYAPLYEAIAQTSDELMEKFFADEKITRQEAVNAIHDGIITGAIIPVYCGAATNMWGVYNLLDSIAESFPRHTAKETEKIVDGDGEKDIEIKVEGAPSVFVFKTVADQFGKLSIFKVMSGTLKKDTLLHNRVTGADEKFSHIYMLRGKKQIEVDELCCGDIGMTSKLSDTNTSDTLTVSEDICYVPTKFPKPYMSRAVSAGAKGDEDKIAAGIGKLLDEDLTLKFENNAETKQMVLYGMSDIHIDVVVSKLKSRYGVSVELTEPKMAYRETIKGRVQVEGKHKKQSGGSGQYGHVKITFSHGEDDGLTFTQSVVGGSVPKGYYPAVEKGLLEAMQKGVLAGYPVVNLAADLFDGSYHAVDSNEISFKLAAKLAYKEGLPKANPILLEPIVELKVSVPESLVGDVIGDLNKRRGRVGGMNPDPEKEGNTIVEAEVPKGEMSDYTITLRAMTQGRGKFDYEFVRYEEVPGNIAQKIIAEAKNDDDDE